MISSDSSPSSTSSSSDSGPSSKPKAIVATQPEKAEDVPKGK